MSLSTVSSRLVDGLVDGDRGGVFGLIILFLTSVLVCFGVFWCGRWLRGCYKRSVKSLYWACGVTVGYEGSFESDFESGKFYCES